MAVAPIQLSRGGYRARNTKGKEKQSPGKKEERKKENTYVGIGTESVKTDSFSNETIHCRGVINSTRE